MSAVGHVARLRRYEFVDDVTGARSDGDRVLHGAAVDVVEGVVVLFAARRARFGRIVRAEAHPRDAGGRLDLVAVSRRQHLSLVQLDPDGRLSAAVVDRCALGRHLGRSASKNDTLDRFGLTASDGAFSG